MIDEKEVKKMMEGVDLSELNELQQGEELVLPNAEKQIDFTRPIDEYGTKTQIVDHLRENWDHTEHIYSESLRQNGKVVQDSMNKYLSTEAYSSSNLKDAIKTPLHLLFAINTEWKLKIDEIRGDASYFKLGTFLHECILEPTKFDRTVVEPKESRSSTAGVMALIDFWTETIKTNITTFERSEEILDRASMVYSGAALSKDGAHKLATHKEHLVELISLSGLANVSEIDKIKIDACKFNYNRYAGGVLPRIIKHSKREISIYGNDPVTGLPVKIRPDALAFKENIGVDAIISIKSTATSDIRKFFYDTAKYSYHLSEGFYQNVASHVTGRDFNTTLTIMFQTIPPFAVALFIWTPEDIEWGKYRASQALQTALECKEKDSYPSYDAFAESGDLGIIEMKLPDWIKRELPPMDIQD